MKCISIFLVLVVAAWFWFKWWHEFEVYMAEKKTITTMLSDDGLTHIRVFPKSEGCYTYNARRNDIRVVTGTVCLDGAP